MTEENSWDLPIQRLRIVWGWCVVFLHPWAWIIVRWEYQRDGIRGVSCQNLIHCNQSLMYLRVLLYTVHFIPIRKAMISFDVMWVHAKCYHLNNTVGMCRKRGLYIHFMLCVSFSCLWYYLDWMSTMRPEFVKYSEWTEWRTDSGMDAFLCHSHIFSEAIKQYNLLHTINPDLDAAEVLMYARPIHVNHRYFVSANGLISLPHAYISD